MRFHVFALMFLLAACGPSGFRATMTESDVFGGPIDSSLVSLPTRGTISYEGTTEMSMSRRVTGDAVMRGDLALTLDMGTDVAHGAVSGLIDGSGTPYQGQLDVTNGTLNRDGGEYGGTPVLTAALTGILTDSGDRELTIGAAIRSDFIGEDGATITGGVTGTYRDGTMPVRLVTGTFEASAVARETGPEPRP